MLQNFAFTLYEIFGYLLPGGVALLALVLLYWALFVPAVPLDVAGFQLSLGAWTLVVVLSYVLGHAVQALGNKLLKHIEDAALSTGGDAVVNEKGRELAAELLGIATGKIEVKWLYRTLDEYAVQNGKPGDRDMYIYREGFYRGTCIALFLLSLTLLTRLAFSGASIQFTKWLFVVSSWQLLLTATFAAALGWLFLLRYKRFATYRVTRAVLAALVIRQSSRAGKFGDGKFGDRRDVP